MNSCEQCSLYSESHTTPCVPGYGAKRPKILFVGEAPGREEMAQGIPFVGKAGKILHDALDVLHLESGEYRLTNVVRCRPPNNRTPRAKEIEHCLPFLEQEILECKPKVIVLLGNTPLKAVLGETGITTWNGVVVERDGITYVPAFHPSFFNYGNSDKLEDWLQALTRAVEVANGEEAVTSADVEFIYPMTLDEVLAMRDELLVYDGFISYDVEAQYLELERPGNCILSFAFGIEGKAWSVPFLHDGALWYEDDLIKIVAYTKPILISKNIIGHNVRFDRKATHTLLGIDFTPWGDTMLLSQLHDSRKGIHGLKRLAGLHLGMFDYDRELKDYIAEHPDCDYSAGGHYGNVPLTSILLPYGARDAAATWQLHNLLYDKLTDKQKILYRQLLMPVDAALGNMESNGFKLDRYIADRYHRIYTIVRDNYYEQILEDPDVRKLIRRRRKGNKKYQFNPNSSRQFAELMHDIKGHKVTERTPTGKPSTRAEVIKNNTVKDDPIYEPYRRWKLMRSMLDKYLEPAASGKWDHDGRVRSNYNLGGTKTGRLSSSSPNLQNIPTPEKEPGTLLAQLPIKNIFTHTWQDGCLCAVDYGSMELRVLASVANCPAMIEAFREGRDPHALVTRMIFPDTVPADASDSDVKHKYRIYRHRSKGASFALTYGGDEHTLMRSHGLSRDEAKHIITTYFEKFPEIPDYQRRIVDFALRNGYVETPFGRRLYLPFINDRDRAKAAAERRTAVNMPIQSLASDILLCAITVIDHFMQQDGYKTLLVNTVHDSIVADVYPGELEKFSELCVEVMENIAWYAQEFFPDLDFSWLRVPLKADVEVGSHYGILEGE